MMEVEVIDNNDMPFLVRGVSNLLSIGELMDLMKKVPKLESNFVFFTLKNSEFITNSRSFATLVANYWLYLFIIYNGANNSVVLF